MSTFKDTRLTFVFLVWGEVFKIDNVEYKCLQKGFEGFKIPFLKYEIQMQPHWYRLLLS